MTREERNARQRERRRAVGDAYTKKYEKTPKGFLMRAHRNMRSRVAGIQKAKAHLYCHITEVVERDVFYSSALFDPEFTRLFNEWTASGYDRRLTPSVDRIDPTKGYELDNIQWITHSENSRRGSISRQEKLRQQKQAVKVY